MGCNMNACGVNMGQACQTKMGKTCGNCNMASCNCSKMAPTQVQMNPPDNFNGKAV